MGLVTVQPLDGSREPARGPWRARERVLVAEVALASSQRCTVSCGRCSAHEHVLDAPAQSPYNSDASRRRGLDGRADAVVLPGSAEEVAAVVRLVLRARRGDRARAAAARG